MKNFYYWLMLFVCSFSMAQTTISGTVKDNKNEPIAGANVKISDGSSTATNGEGKFVLKTSKKPPFDIIVSRVGFDSQTVSVTSSQSIDVVMTTSENRLEDVVVSASRTPERIKESPVTIERMGVKDVKRTASPTFYDGLENLKEVQMNTSSMSFKSINTRGFATVSNTRFMQLVDGMDNSSPLLNFVIGNMIGVSDIDVQSVELLPGASSALYGANAFNGILFMNSKSPFTSPGISAYAKYGMTSQEAAGTNNYYDVGVRLAHKFSNYFAAKGNFTYMQATDWYATDYNGVDPVTGDRVLGDNRSNPNYNGVNVYGDEASTNIKDVGSKLAQLGLIPSSAVNLLPDASVSRTGYNEIDLTDNKVKNIKADFSLHLKPWADDVEIIWQSKFGFGNAVYQGANRYYLNGFNMQQHKIEVRGDNFFLRSYMTAEGGGKSYDMLFTGINVNRQWKSDETWFGEYAGAYISSTLGGATPQQAHANARATADTGRYLPGTTQFQQAMNKVTGDSDVRTGSKLVDNSKIYHSDANYNFKNQIKFMELQVGGSYRLYSLNSYGRIYTDHGQNIDYDEYGLYTQIQKKLMEDRLKLTGSIRYDKSQNFKGNYSPRLSVVYSAGEKKNHNFRASFQTGFRNPTTQDQYIGFDVGRAVLVGSAADNLDRFYETRGGGGTNGTISSISPLGVGFDGITILSALNGTPTSQVLMTGHNAYENAFTAESAAAFGAALKANPTPVGFVAAATKLQKANVALVKPETVKAFELGYKGQIQKLAYDLNGYYNIYNHFIGNKNVVAPYYGNATTSPNAADLTAANISNVYGAVAIANQDYRVYQLYTNTDVEIKSLGFGAGVSYALPKNFTVVANYNYAEFQFDQSKDADFEAGFNTPKHRVKIGLSNDKVYKNLGFNISGRYNTGYQWESTFVDGWIHEATVFDAQLSYGLPKLKSVIKLGGTNLGRNEYRQVLGAGLIGSQYFLGLTYNP